jgi:hypothetical protein
MDPFAAFRPLAAHVEHFEHVALDAELDANNANGADSVH